MSRKKQHFNDYDLMPGLFDDLGHLDIRRKADDADEAKPAPTALKTAAIRFMSFGSGSSGNCAYVGDSNCGFLIDAGVDAEYVVDTLRRNGIAMEKVLGVILTHDHSDHVRRIYSLVRHHRHMKVFATNKVMDGILRRHSISRRLKDYHTAIFKEFKFYLGEFTITPFNVHHDGTDNNGFFIEHSSGATMAVATDLGSISDRVEYYMKLANFIVIESNYNLQMLLTGRYPEHLKHRIRSENGHLDNNDTAAFLASLVSPQLSHIFLCHLSQDNNTPTLAIETSRNALLAAGVTAIGDASESLEAEACPIQLYALPRHDASPLFHLKARASDVS